MEQEEYIKLPKPNQFGVVEAEVPRFDVKYVYDDRELSAWSNWREDGFWWHPVDWY